MNSGKYVVTDVDRSQSLKVTRWEAGILDANGANTTSTDYPNAMRSDFIKIRAAKYTFNIDYCQVYWYDENKNLVANSGVYGTNNGIQNGNVCEAPIGARYLRIYRAVGKTDCSIDCSLIERTIESVNGDLPSVIEFGLDNGTTNSTDRELSLVEVININTGNLTTLRRMFAYCKRVEKINTSNWNTSKVTNMYDAFIMCYNLTSLDASNWDTSNVFDLFHSS